MDFDPQKKANFKTEGPSDAQRVADETAMLLALNQAQIAEKLDEVPIGAVIIQTLDPETGQALETPQTVALAHNDREVAKNPVGHAELKAIELAALKLKRWRLTGCTLYVTLEPCTMCAGAIVLSRLDRVVYGTPDPKAGAVESLYRVLEDKRLNHRPQVTRGVLETECAQILKDFFAKKRLQKKLF